ncbi:MAG: arylsulfatase [Candidatus Rokuibacteriota bacterium]|nr:MAG: arylsulfatase [Candidatus Rokubacteria bacterium]
MNRESYDATGFRGRVERTRADSEPWWPTPARAPRGAPNIVIVYMDDMGYSDPRCFGSEIDTPNIDALAARGLRFNHYTTHPICSPARAALLTGRNAHAVGTGWLANNNAGFPGYTGEIPLDAATQAETLRAGGYATMMVGKWHNTPGPLSLPSSVKDSWPTQRGFEQFYGFMEGETSFFFPARLMLGNTLLPIDEYPPDYYATDDWMDKAIAFVREHRVASPDTPFFLYVANNAVHAPFQAKAKDLAKYRGRYDEGWTRIREARFRRQLELGLIPPDTRLAPSDPMVCPWDATDPADRPLFTRHMETYAAMLDCADQNLGRLVAFLRELGELDNTIVVFSSDNGGTHSGGPIGSIYNNRRFSGLPEDPIERERERLDLIGGPRSNALYPTGWGQVSNTPFPTYKTYTGGGGRRVSFVVSWPARIADAGAIRSHFVHVTDVMPTLLELASVPPLADVNGRRARELHGRSFAAALLDAEAPSPRREQYYECWSNRGFYRDGWLARSLQKRGEPIDLDSWTLHDLTRDFSESVDVRELHPQKLRELVLAFDDVAWANLVYPLDNRTMVQKMSDGAARGATAAGVARRFPPGTQTAHRAIVVPLISDRSYRIRATFVWRDADQGVIWAIGEQIGGMVLFVEDAELRLCYNGYGEWSELPAVALTAGEIEATLEYEALGKRQGQGRILVDGIAKTPWQSLSPTLMVGFHEGLDVGIDRRAPVSWDVFEKHGTFPYTGTIHGVTIEPGPRAPDSPLAHAR